MANRNIRTVTDNEQDFFPGAGHPPAESTAQARIVAIEAGKVWLEPMQTGSCGGCASSTACGTNGIGSIANRLEARRFSVPGSFAPQVGDQVEVAFGNRNLIKAAAVAYVLPLLSALFCAGLAQRLVGTDGVTMFGALLGMLAGFAAMRFVARRMEAGGTLQARIVSRHQQTIHFSHPGASFDA